MEKALKLLNDKVIRKQKKFREEIRRMAEEVTTVDVDHNIERPWQQPCHDWSNDGLDCRAREAKAKNVMAMKKLGALILKSDGSPVAIWEYLFRQDGISRTKHVDSGKTRTANGMLHARKAELEAEDKIFNHIMHDLIKPFFNTRKYSSYNNYYQSTFFI